MAGGWFLRDSQICQFMHFKYIELFNLGGEERSEICQKVCHLKTSWMILVNHQNVSPRIKQIQEDGTQIWLQFEQKLYVFDILKCPSKHKHYTL